MDGNPDRKKKKRKGADDVEVETTKLKEPSKGVKETEQEKVEEASSSSVCTPLATVVTPLDCRPRTLHCTTYTY